METVNYRITEGSDYGWNCYGPNAHSLTAWNEIHGDGGWGASIVFDTKDQTVYEVEICDYTNQRAYRIINPDFRKEYDKESKDRGELADCAWDDVKFTDLEVDDDWIQKALAIIAGEKYDTRIKFQVEFNNDELFKYMLLAHEKDITLNQLVELAVQSAIDEYERNPKEFLAKHKK